MKKMAIGKVLLAVVILSWGLAQGDEYGSVLDKQIFDQGRWWDDQEVLINDVFARAIEVAQAAENEDELELLLADDPLVQELGAVLASDIMVSTINAGYCYLTPLICLWRSYAADLRCTYSCIGLYGLGEITTNQTSECDRVVGCILFQNCLAVCITIIPHDPPPVIR